METFNEKIYRIQREGMEELKKKIHSGELVFHHEAWAKGYESRKGKGYAVPYSGRYGIGYVVHMPSWYSTRYHHVYYYISSAK